MHTYYFQLGNTPTLSLLELQQTISPEVVLCELANSGSGLPAFATYTQEELADTADWQEKLGGTVKILEHIADIHTQSTSEIEDRITQFLSQQGEKIQFGITTMGDASQNQQVQVGEGVQEEVQEEVQEINESTIKHLLANQGVKSRYRTSTSDGLSAAVLLNSEIEEVYILHTPAGIKLAHTTTVQDIDDWTNRDRNKPYANRKKGMLPPKVARMLINIGIGLLPNSTTQNQSAPTIYDPFCGSGTILMEAMMRHCDVQGSDLDQKSVQGAGDNLTWLAEAYQLDNQFSVVQHDATQGFGQQTHRWADAIVTEPFLGKPTPQEKELPHMFKGLYNMYLGALKNWPTILQPGAPVVLIVPFVEGKNHTYHLQKLIDKFKSLGYTTVSEPIIYGRPQAIVQREIHFLRYQA